MANATKVTETLIAWVLAGLFLYAGALKLLQPSALLADIQSYNLVPYRMAYLGAYLLPGLEIAAGVGLLFRRFRRESTWIVTVLMVVFVAVLGSAWARGLDITCGCFGKADTKANYPLLIGRDLLILLGCGIIFYLRRPQKT